MITCKLQGGLGNQLFQIATTIALASENGVDYAFDFNVPCINQGYSPMKYRDTIYRDLGDLPKGWLPQNIYKEPHFHYMPIPFKDNTELRGYFQSEKYFSGQWITMWNMVMGKNDIRAEVCSIHVRRGDYKKFKDYHNNLPLRYYMDAIFLMKDFGVNKFMVFSDDIEYCKSVGIFDEFEFIDGDELDCLRLMCNCRHHIMANSSFSWWASWLSDDGWVIAPSDWFGPKAKHNTKDLIPERWITI